MTGSSPHTTVEVAVPLPLHQTFHYTVPADLRDRAVPGARVTVRFGPRRLVGYIVARDTPAPEGVRLAPVLDIPDEPPLFDAEMLSFVAWLARYYHASLGEALRGAHPAGINAGDAPGLELTSTGSAGFADAPALQGLVGGAKALAKLDPRPDAETVKAWVKAGWVRRTRVARNATVKRSTRRGYRVIEAAPGEPAPTEHRAPTRDALYRWLEGRGDVLRSEILEAFPSADGALRALAKAGKVAKVDIEVDRDPFLGKSVPRDVAPMLTSAQRVAVDALVGHSGYGGFLLQGITGSGKTEVYLHAIEAALEAGRGALVLVPEIGLTPQAVQRFRARLGDVVAVLHSGLAPGARYDQWRRLRSGELKVAIGARSALFAPVANLGLIVVDEAHDPSFKQHEGVRYHARDMSLVRGARCGAVVILGSATPSLESTHNANTGKLKRLVLPERATGGALPRVEFVDLRTQRAPADEAPFLSTPMRMALMDTLARGEQTILFLNRRGFSNFVRCEACGHVVECENCAIAMTWHRGKNRLSCHYCDAARGWPQQCPECNQAAMALPGRGTERLEAALNTLFPNARVARMDRDTAAGAKSEAILADVAAGRTDILVGTQMVTKGHDFPNVTLVGVIDADGALNLPDFRAAERTFQRLTQVAGRAGRGSRAGRVLIQTWNPDDETLRAVGQHDHGALSEAEIPLRQIQGYPPYAHAVALRIDGRDSHIVQRLATAAAEVVRVADTGRKIRVRGPAPAPLERLRGKTRWTVLLTALERAELHGAIAALKAADLPLGSGDPRVVIDVDPYDFL